MQDITKKIAQELGIKDISVNNTVELFKDGLMGLLAKYTVHNKGYSCVKEEMYLRLQELYFLKQAPSLLNCYTKLKKEYYLKGIWQIPSYVSFARKIRAEFTSEQINFLRGKISAVNL